MTKLVLALLAGLAAHQANKVIEGWEDANLPPAWTRIARYIVGAVVTLPAYIMIRRGDNRDQETDKDIQAYLMAFVGVGVGVAVGYLTDELIGNGEK